MFDFVYSEPLTLKISDPCSSAIVNFDGTFVPTSIKVPMFSTWEVEELDGPVDSASQEYGTISLPRICDRFYYEILSEDKKQILSPSYLTLEVDYKE